LVSTTSFTLPAVPRTVCTGPDSASAPMCAFMPKYHCRPFWLCFISGSRSPLLFLVEVGAAIKVAFISGPSSFRVERDSQNHWSSSSPVGMWAGCI